MLLFRPLITFLLLKKNSLMLRTLIVKLLGLVLLRVITRWDSEYALANVIKAILGLTQSIVFVRCYK